MKKSFYSILLSALLLPVTFVSAQQQYHRCSSAEYLHQQLLADPGLAARMQAIEEHTQQYANSNTDNSRAVITIPVVVHVVYNTAAQNISDALIQAQINQLNLDYARLNSDASNTPSAFAGVAAAPNIQFCLAQRDPSGNASTGIVRKQTTVTSWSTNDAVKKSSSGGDDAWPSSSYLNIWSCNLGSGLLGYAQFPGGTASTDGVVLLYSSIGSMATPGTASPYNLGRTATHEVGHWLNLYHIWGDDGTGCTGTDNVGDTPNQAGENYGCPAFPTTDGCTSTSPGVMFMNYMDYTDDGCMNMFTAGQATRMNALFATGGARLSLVSSLGCQPVVACNVPGTLSTGTIGNNSATFSWAAVSGAVSYGVQYRPTGTATWTTATSTTTTYTASGLTAGTAYEWQVKTNCSAGLSAYSSSATFTTTGTAPCNVASTLTASAITSSSATISWAAVSGAVSYNVQYRVVGAASWTTTSTTTTSVALSALTTTTNYEWQVQTVCSAGSSAFSASATFTTASTCTDVYESNNTSATAKTAPLNTDFTAIISSTTDVDWFKFTTVSPNVKVKVDLTNLPADYDVVLYKSNASTKLGTGANGGTTSEQIKYNATTTGTYYVKVYGYNGAYSANSCYKLRISTGSTNFRTDGETLATDEQEVEVFAESALKLYPNPASNALTVEYVSATEGDVWMIVYNLSGQRVLQQQTTAVTGGNKQTINTESLSSGVYVLQINNGGQIQHIKFTINQ